MTDEQGIRVAQITITRTLTEDDDIIGYEKSDGLTAVEAVGMLTMTVDSILREGDDDD